MSLSIGPSVVTYAGAPATPRGRALRWAEFVAIYIAAPLGMALFLPPAMLFRALFVFTIAGLLLLALTGGYDWRAMLRGWRRLPWAEAGAMGAALIAVSLLILWLVQPDAILALPRQRPDIMVMIWVFYPFLSALPQELIFRALFFHRYAALMPSVRVAVAVNAGVFAFAHLMYWSVIVLVLTAAGGWLFARAYLTRGFPSAWFLHALAGNLLFAIGMGVFFYSGNVVRPF